MKLFSTALTVLAMILSLTATSFAQTAAGRQTASENRVADAAGGYSFAVPTGWTKKDAADGSGGFALVNTAQTIIIAVKAHNYQNFEAFAANANLREDGLELVGDVQNFSNTGKAFRTAKRTAQGALVVDTVVLFSPHGDGVVVVGLSDNANEKTSAQTAYAVAQTVQFSKPQASAASNQWQNFLRGKHLIFLQTSGSFSDRTDIYLCSTGEFVYKSDSSGLSTGGAGDLSMVSSNGGNGTWRIASGGAAAQLILQFKNGSTREYALVERQTAGEISLNDKRYFVKSDAACR